MEAAPFLISLPMPLLRCLHEFSDIDTRRNIEQALHWPSIPYRLKGMHAMDFVELKSNAAKLKWMEYENQGLSLYIYIPISECKSYWKDIEIPMRWKKVKDGVFRIPAQNLSNVVGCTETFLLDWDTSYRSDTYYLYIQYETYECREENGVILSHGVEETQCRHALSDNYADLDVKPEKLQRYYISF